MLNSLWIADTLFSGCSATAGGSIALYQSEFVLSFAQDTFQIEDSQFVLSSAVANGGALDIWGLPPMLQLMRTTFQRVSAGLRGGMARFVNCLSVLLNKCSSSLASTGEGGSIYAESVRTLSIQRSNFSHSSATTKGGSICALFSTLSITDSIFQDTTLSFNADTTRCEWAAPSPSRAAASMWSRQTSCGAARCQETSTWVSWDSF